MPKVTHLMKDNKYYNNDKDSDSDNENDNENNNDS